MTLFLFHTFQSQQSNYNHEEYFLATVDVTRGEELDPESSLKIWVYTSPNANIAKKYKLLTQVDSPHGTHRISSLVFFTSSPSRPSLASSSSDGTIKIWMRLKFILNYFDSNSFYTLLYSSAFQQSNGLNQPSPWICSYSFTYRLNYFSFLYFFLIFLFDITNLEIVLQMAFQFLEIVVF